MSWTTHQVENQVPPLANYNLYGSDAVLRSGLQRSPGIWHEAALERLGAELGDPEVMRLGELANRHAPELVTHDRFGQRIDTVEFHPAWHTLLGMLRRAGLHALPWFDQRPGAHTARAIGYYLHAQVEAGSLCPTTMTFAAIQLLKGEPALFTQLQQKLFSCQHDSRDLPWEHKESILLGMGMTEKQGGSDVRSNSSRARPLDGGGRGGAYTLTGHKWFFSAPMCDAHLMLARTDNGLSCFFVPRWHPDGSRNAIHIQRLKDKLGNRSNASAEVEFRDAWGIMVGAEGRGIPTIIDMVNHTRFDCVIASAGMMRQALVQAIHHARHRSAFGRMLAEQALMQNVLSDLALESEAAALLMLRLAQAFDQPDDPLEGMWRRVLTPAAKFWVCKRALEFTGECMEVWGGNGYVETGPMARLYREAPVNSIWEGSGNIMCLDVLRAVERDPEDFARMLAQLEQDAQAHAGLRALVASLRDYRNGAGAPQEMLARRFTQRLVLAVQGVLMLSHAGAASAEAFLASRIDAECGRVYGTLSTAAVQREILDRAWPL